MKTRILSAVVLLIGAGPACAQSSSAVLYGRLQLGLEHLRLKTDAAQAGAPSLREANYRSIVGVRGSEALGGGLQLLYQVESTVAPDTGGGAIAARDTRVGLQGGWGTLFAGNWTTPYNSATSGLDPFYVTTAGYMSILGNGAAPGDDNVSDTVSFDRRQRNSLHWWSPSWRGLTLRVAHGFNEERPASGARPALDSAALVFEQGRLYATLAHEIHRDYQGPGLDDSASKLGLAWRFGATRVAAIAERLRYETARGPLRRSAYYVSLSHQRGAHGLRLGLARARDAGGMTGLRLGGVVAGPDSGATHATLGYDYALSPRTTLFVFHTRLDNDARGAADFGINGLGAGAGARLDATALGVRHSF
jgi:predicted porin